ncbi:MAG: BlaI/MecI/CopY family transcriptional regulator, partial [Myxococcota bacterium]
MPISAAEQHVMNVLWDSSPRTADEIVEILESRHDWKRATIKTLINRLLNKGVIVAEKDGRKYRYSPSITRESYLREESSGFLDRLFDGKLSAMVSHFSSSGQLGPEDLAELKAVLEGLER